MADGRAAFLDRFGGVYENSPWIAERVFDRGPSASDDGAESLHAAMRDIVAGAGRVAQLALLRAHPDLAGRLAVAGELTADSKSEQAGAGLDQCSDAEFNAFGDLNGQYTAKFGFPFIIAVRGLGRRDILDAFRRRIDNAPDEEFATALEQVHRIAMLRLADLF